MPASCNFYILPDAASERRFLFCCSLIEKIAEQNPLIYVHCQHQEEAEQFSDLLWSYSETSFLPHCIVGEYPLDESPIQIGWNPPPGNYHGILLFLAASPDLPDFHQQFERIVDVVNQDSLIKEALRVRYQRYRECGYEIKTHKV